MAPPRVAFLLSLAALVCAPALAFASWPSSSQGAVTICGSVQAQSSPQACPDGEGGSYITWTDQRNGSADVQRLHRCLGHAPRQALCGGRARQRQPVRLANLAGVVDVATTSVPRELFLAAPAPNPARAGATLLRFGLPRAARVTLALFDSQGRRVRTLLAGRLAAGGHAVRWDGADERDRALPVGIYACRLELEDRCLTRRLTLLR
jgi:hypothetical protein